MPVHDAHCHFFSARFFELLAQQMPDPPANPAQALPERLGWEAPGSPEELADRWRAELDRHGVGRAALIASAPTDEDSVAAAVLRHPQRFVGFFMLDPTSGGAEDRARRAFRLGLRAVCLFPAMHRYAITSDAAMKVFEIAAAQPGAAVFVHCGVLSVGVRKKLGLASRFEIRYGNPLDLHGPALAFPHLPIIVPHFGAGLFREALMLADLCPNVLLDTSSSNSWIRYHPGLTLESVFRQALEVAGADRLLFGTDSSFFPRGWHNTVYEAQAALLEGEARERVMWRNFERTFPAV
jgi:predicted TIM-barrel fold metal-dependent hydrolase